MLKVPLASTVPCSSSATANGLPGTPAAAQASASRDLVEGPQAHERVAAERLDRGRQRAAHAAALRGEDREAEPARLDVHQLGAAAELRPLLGDLERPARVDLGPQRAELARQREHRDAERGDPEQRDGEPDREPALGRRLVAVEQRQDRERDGQRRGARERGAADAAARAEARTRRAAAPRGQHDGLRERERTRTARRPPTRRPRRRRRPPTASDRLDGDQPAPHRARRGSSWIP